MKDSDNLVKTKIKNQLEQIAGLLMKHENKPFCLEGISHKDWRIIQVNEMRYIIVPSSMFKCLILNREYIKVVDKYPNKFGTKNDWDVVKALKLCDKNAGQISDEEYFNYINNETMAYIFKVDMQDNISERILRLDLCRRIRTQDNTFQGGLFHIFKHFTLDGYKTISSKDVGEYKVETFSDLYTNVITNFFSDVYMKEKENCYVAYSQIRDGHTLRGVYYKEDSIPVSFLDSIRVDRKAK